ncbi:MAG: hypothetical protein WC269_03335 [Candidatus Gracilibacteria bacterium]|jgi:hypothetical protein
MAVNISIDGSSAGGTTLDPGAIDLNTGGGVATGDRGTMIDAIQNYDTLEIINRGIAYAIIIAGFLSLVFIFVGGISFILSGGQEDKIKSAVSTIRYSIIGLIVTILAVVIVGTVGKAMNLNVIEYINFGDIIDTIKNITSSAGSGSSPTLK